MVETFEVMLSVIDSAIDTPRKKHLVGGALLSASFFFAGLAITIMTLSKEDLK